MTEYKFTTHPRLKTIALQISNVIGTRTMNIHMKDVSKLILNMNKILAHKMMGRKIKRLSWVSVDRRWHILLYKKGLLEFGYTELNNRSQISFIDGDLIAAFYIDLKKLGGEVK